jgi:hypothetical protein
MVMVGCITLIKLNVKHATLAPMRLPAMTVLHCSALPSVVPSTIHNHTYICPYLRTAGRLGCWQGLEVIVKLSMVMSLCSLAPAVFWVVMSLGPHTLRADTMSHACVQCHSPYSDPPAL